MKLRNRGERHYRKRFAIFPNLAQLKLAKPPWGARLGKVYPPTRKPVLIWRPKRSYL